MNNKKKNEIIKMCKTLGPDYSEYSRDSLNYANKKIDTFASLLIAIAFSSIGLSVQLLNREIINSDIISWGIISLTMSIIFGLLQLIIDNRFFIKMHKIYNKISAKCKFISDTGFGKKDVEELLKYSKEHKYSRINSNIRPLYAEVFFVILGTILILSQLLFQS